MDEIWNETCSVGQVTPSTDLRRCANITALPGEALCSFWSEIKLHLPCFSPRMVVMHWEQPCRARGDLFEKGWPLMSPWALQWAHPAEAYLIQLRTLPAFTPARTNKSLFCRGSVRPWRNNRSEASFYPKQTQEETGTIVGESFL